MSNFGFGANPFGQSVGQLGQMQGQIAKLQEAAAPDKTPGGEVEGALVGPGMLAQTIKGVGELKGKVKKGKKTLEDLRGQAREGVNTIRDATGANENEGLEPLMQHLKENPPEGPEGLRAGPEGVEGRGGALPTDTGPTPSVRPLGSDETGGTMDSATRSVTGQSDTMGRPTPSRASAGADGWTDGDGTPHQFAVPQDRMTGFGNDSRMTPMPSGPGDTIGFPSKSVPKMNVGNTINGTVGQDASSMSHADFVAGKSAKTGSGFLNDLTDMSAVGRDVGSSIGKDVAIDAGAHLLESTVGEETGLEALGPIGDVLAAGAGIYGAIKAHVDKVQEVKHDATVSAGIQSATTAFNTHANTLATSVGRMGNTMSNAGQQQAQGHF